MKACSLSEKLLIDEITQATRKARVATRGLTIGTLIKSICTQLGMSQNALARRAGVPLLQDSIDTIRRKQARKMGEKQVHYLKGTMNLEDQQPDARFIEELIKQEEERFLQGPSAKLWNENA